MRKLKLSGMPRDPPLRDGCVDGGGEARVPSLRFCITWNVGGSEPDDNESIVPILKEARVGALHGVLTELSGGRMAICDVLWKAGCALPTAFSVWAVSLAWFAPGTGCGFCVHWASGDAPD